jgi:O-antigen/teichoic acid export membrane protein
MMDNDGKVATPQDIKGILERLIELAKDSLVYGLTNAAAGFVGLLLLPIYTRVFLPAEYGILALITATTQVLVLIVGLQTESGVARYYYEKKEEERKTLISTGLLLRLFFSIPFFLILLPWTGEISQVLFGSAIYGTALFISFLTIPLSVLFGYFLLLLRLQRASFKYGILAVGNFALMAILNIYFVVYLKIGIEGVFWGFLIAYLLFSFAALWFLRKSFVLSFSRPFAKEILVYSIPIVPAVLVGWLRTYIDRFLLIPFVGLAGVGVFSAGISVSSFVLLITSAFTLAWLPFSMSMINHENHRAVYSKVLTYYTALLSSAAILITVFSYEVVRFLVPQSYWEAHTIVGFLTLGIVLYGVLSIIGIGLNIVKKTYLITFAFLTGIASGVIVLLLLTPIIGIMGAAIAASVSSATALFVEYYLSQKNYYINYELKKVGSIIFIFIVFIFLTMAINGIGNDMIRSILKVGELCFYFACIVKILGSRELLEGSRFLVQKLEHNRLFKFIFSNNHRRR